MSASRLDPRGHSLGIVVLLLVAVLASLIAGSPGAAAAGSFYVTGNACASSSNPTWLGGDTWILYGNVTVPSGCTLTIQPGVTVLGDPDVHLYVGGTLVAGGSPASLIQFQDNQTTGIPWAGIQFNSGATGSVTWSSFRRVLVAILAQSSSPAINNNTIVQAGTGIRLDSSNSVVADNRIDGGKLGSVGILLATANSRITRNTINDTSIGIQAMTAGSPTISENTITNLSGTVTLGIYATNQAALTITGNTVRGGFGSNGGPGGDGTTAVGILANGTPSVTIAGNSIAQLRGGRGGLGPNSAVGAGGTGGLGGGAAGIAVGSASTVLLQANTIDNVTGARGGDGGTSTVGNGGPGGAGGQVIGIEVFAASSSASYLGNAVSDLTAGPGGDGGQPPSAAFSTGSGGSGGSAYGIFSLKGLDPNLSSNTVQSVQGARGGNSTAGGTSSAGGIGAPGGEATGLLALADGSSIVHANQIGSLLAGAGGNGITRGGAGGNASGVLVLADGTPYNRTTLSFNRITTATGGAGGIGGTLSGDGGAALGVAAIHVNASLASNTISNLVGGNGGDAFVLVNQASKGGDAAGFSLLLVPSGSSIEDSVQSSSGGLPGTGKSPPSNYGVGFYFAGNSTVTTRASVTNDSFAGIGAFALYVDNYSAVTTLNTPFDLTMVAVQSAGNLTVRNFLALTALWPNNATPVAGATFTVTDNAATIYNRVSPQGSAQWIVVTNRVYRDSSTPTWNTTQASVSFLTDSFASNPRVVNMTTSQSQAFTMIDTVPPTSSAGPLPAWENVSVFPVPFSFSDGNGTGVASVTLWYNLNNTAWQMSSVQAVSGSGTAAFSFAATADGYYQFATTAVDAAGNAQAPSPPTANTTWTVLDTVAPGSHVLPLPRFERSLSFTVSWAPNSGVTDIATYTVQVNTGTGWVDWQADTTQTTALYTSTAQGAVAFRTLATDFAGNAESKAGNDTWTTIDSIAPQVVADVPTGNLTAAPSGIQITFSEPMNESAVEAAFSLSPSVAGTFTWSNGSTTLRFRPSSTLALGTSYTVTIGTGATDVAGNGLAQADVFTFTLPAPLPAPGLSLGDLWPFLVIIAAGLALLLFFVVRRRGATSAPETVLEPPKPAPAPASSKSEAAIDDVFLLYRRDGVLIKHETRRLRPDIDTDILSGMLTAVQQFVKDSFHGDEGEELNEMTVGQMHILIGRGKWLVLAATLTGGDIESMTAQIQKAVEDMETHNWDRLEDWDGDMDLAKALGPYLKKLIRGEYAA